MSERSDVHDTGSVERSWLGIGQWTLHLADGSRTIDADAAELLGLSPSPCRLSQAEWTRLLHPSDVATLGGELGYVPSRTISFRIYARTGGWRWLEERVRHNGHGEPGTVDGVWIDVSAAKLAEVALLERERRIRGALQVADNGWWEWDLQREWFSIAPNWLAMFGLSTSDAGRGLDAWLALAVPAEHPMIREAVQAHLEDRARNIDVTFRMASTFRGERWIEARGAVVERRGDGRPARLLGTFVDQTEQYRAAREQKGLLAKFELACESAGIGLVQYDWKHDRWSFDSRSQELLAFGEQGQPGSLLDFLRRLPAEDADRVQTALLAGTSSQQGPISLDFRILGRERPTRDIQAMARVHFGEEGQLLDLIGVVMDVTEDREARRLLEAHRSQLGVLVSEQTQAAIDARDRAQHASAIKSEFLANISHELRTPLHAIIGFSQLALDDADQLDAATAQSYFGKINGGARHLLRLVDDLLDLSKLESGHMSLAREIQGVRRLLQSVCDEVAPLAAARRIRIDLQADESLQWPLDATRFGQVVRNLVMNAIKYSPDAGVVEVHVVTLDNGELEMRIRDHGGGIPAEALEQIFERFRQGTNAARREGTGLGLAIARELVALHRGTVGAHNHPDGGAEFVVQLAVERRRGERDDDATASV